jgi:hypothetical protein
MNDEQLDRLVSAATVSDTALEQLDLTDGEADLLEAILMDNNASNPIVGSHGPATTTRRRSMRRGVLITGIVGALIVGGGAVTASTLLDGQSEKFLESARCSLDSKDATRVATATVSNGSTTELWVVRSAGGSGELIVQKGPDGQLIGNMLGCSPADQQNRPEGTPFAATPRDANSEHTYVHLFGWVPTTAASVIVTLGEGTRVELTPEASGYFLEEVTLPASANDLADPVSMDLLDTSGAVIQHIDL